MRMGFVYSFRGQLKFYNRAVRSSFLMSEEERLVWLFVLDRTIGWKKAAERISMSEFQGGVFRRVKGHRTVVTPGTGLGYEQITCAIASLVDCGALHMEGDGRTVWYGVDEDWCHPLLRGSKYETWKLTEDDYLYDDREWNGFKDASVGAVR